MSDIANDLYPQSVWMAWHQQTRITMPFLGDPACQFRIKGLDYGYDVAEMECIEGVYQGECQSVSIALLTRLLNGERLNNAVYYYVNRWFDEFGVAHYFGLFSKYASIEENQRNVTFNVLDVPVDIVYQADDEADMMAYLNDVNNTPDADDFDL